MRPGKKPKKRGHRCSKKRHGKPKIGNGLCSSIIRDAVVERIQGKRLARRWTKHVKDGLDLLDFEGT